MGKFSYLLLLYIFSACNCTLQAESFIKQHDNVYTLLFADFSFSISAEKGGRIISFKSSGKELLTSDSINDRYYGATFWLSPQSQYWPPFRSLDNLPYEAAYNDKSLRLTSMPDTISGLSITKEFTISEADSSVLISYTVCNVSSRPRKLAPWDVARVHGGLSFFPAATPTAADKLDITGCYRDCGIVWVPFIEIADRKAEKLFSGATGGWLANFNPEKGLLFIKCFPDIQPGEVPPGQGEVEVYIAPQGKYTELENHGKYTELQPGKSLTYNQIWNLKAISSDKSKPIDRRKILSYINSFISR